MSTEQQEESHHSERAIPVQMTCSNHHPSEEMPSDEPDYVFHDEPNHRGGRQ